MTREEREDAIDYFKRSYASGNTDDERHHNEVLDMAIKALEQQPCEDWHGVPSDEMTLEQARQAVKDLRKMLPEYLEQNPNEDCISRENLLKAFKDECRGECDNCPHFRKVDREYKCRLIADFPSVTPKEKTGKWIFDEILDRHYYCSECKSMGVDYWDYCPECGAKMIEPQESEEQT